MRLTDDQWIERARARVAAGEPWETPPDEPLGTPPAQPTVSSTRSERCPFCESRPPLEIVYRAEVPSTEPLLRCPDCHGFWARGDALSHGIRDPADDDASFIAAPVRPRCRACGGHLTPGLVCSRCGKLLPPLDCPSCGKPMERSAHAGVTLDTCASCTGTWFDIGEIGQVYGLQPPQGLGARLVDEHACDDEPPGWAMMLGTIVRLVAPFI